MVYQTKLHDRSYYLCAFSALRTEVFVSCVLINHVKHTFPNSFVQTRREVQ